MQRPAVPPRVPDFSVQIRIAERKAFALQYATTPTTLPVHSAILKQLDRSLT